MEHEKNESTELPNPNNKKTYHCQQMTFTEFLGNKFDTNLSRSSSHIVKQQSENNSQPKNKFTDILKNSNNKINILNNPNKIDTYSSNKQAYLIKNLTIES